MPSSSNLFSIARRHGDEDQLTEMLVWLANAVPTVRAALVELGLGRTVDPSTIEAITQYGITGGRLDAMLDGPDFRLAVESKLGSDYQHDQIGKYLRWLSDRKSSKACSGLMTLTAREAPWDEKDMQYASEEGLVGSARRWEELHALLQPVARESDNESLAGKMVQEFLEMLTDEDLVPVRPLDHDELGTRWADSWEAVNRYRRFFDACKDAIAQALSATASPKRRSARGDLLYQDYSLPDMSSVVVGLFCTDENEKASPRRRSPILWIGINAEHLEQWDAVAEALNDQRPGEWREGRPWWGWQTMWRPLADVLRDGTFEEQRTSLATAVTDATRWLEEALARVPSISSSPPAETD